MLVWFTWVNQPKKPGGDSQVRSISANSS